MSSISSLPEESLQQNLKRRLSVGTQSDLTDATQTSNSSVDLQRYVLRSKRLSNSQLETKPLASFDWSEFSVESVLSEGNLGATCGSFSRSYRVCSNQQDNQQDTSDDLDEDQASGSCYKYTLKSLRRSLHQDSLVSNSQCLAAECDILSYLARHPHIVAPVGRSSAFDPGSSSSHYFIVMEGIQETLSDLLRAWRRDPLLSRRLPLLIKHQSNDTRRRIKSSLHRRVKMIAMAVAKALAYIHSKGLVVRNLHANTIGLDADGQVKLFDLSKASPPGLLQSTNKKKNMMILHNSQDVHNSQDMWAVSSDPAIRQEDIGFAGDVYAFGLILWQVASLQELKAIAAPNTSTSTRKISNSSSATKKPPALYFWNVPSTSVQNLLQACWETNPDARPTSSRIRMMLVDQYGHSSVYEYASKKSTPDQLKRKDKAPLRHAAASPILDPASPTHSSNGNRGLRSLFRSQNQEKEVPMNVRLQLNQTRRPSNAGSV